MGKFLVLVVLASCMALVLASGRDQSEECKHIANNCNGFDQCCARRCQSGHRSTCNERNGQIDRASCSCDISGTRATTGSPHGSSFGSDHSFSCRSEARDSCGSFRSCCYRHCQAPTRLTCDVSGRSLTNAHCECPPSRGGGFTTTRYAPFGHQTTTRYSTFGHRTTTRYSPFGHQTTTRYSPFGHQTTTRYSTFGHHTTTRRSSGGVHDIGESDYTSTCQRNSGTSCDSFKDCCRLRCASRSIQEVKCQPKWGGGIKETACKCGR